MCKEVQLLLRCLPIYHVDTHFPYTGIKGPLWMISWLSVKIPSSRVETSINKYDLTQAVNSLSDFLGSTMVANLSDPRLLTFQGNVNISAMPKTSGFAGNVFTSRFDT